MNKYFDLLKSWCDKLMEYQITEIKDKSFRGGILCPACSLIHGRIGDSVYPFTAMYDYTGEEKYLNAARMAVEWSENNVLRENGSYFNDKVNDWTGITVFSAMSFGEALLYHSSCLDSETKDNWMRIFIRLSEFVYEHFKRGGATANINYHITTAAEMALAFKLTGNEKYKSRAYESMEYTMDFFTPEKLLFGECKPLNTDYLSPKGCRGIDIGYNAEESLPAFVMFAIYMDDAHYLELAKSAFRAHLEFMIPDGGWDNSFGSRANKWTYWGSRTSDGCQSALCMLAGDPVFAEAAERNFEMYEKCSKDGLLYGGYMHIEAGEEACTHHSFCHAKSLAAMLDHGFSHITRVPLPRDEEYGVKHFPSLHVNLISKGEFRATVSDCDVVVYDGAATTGGTMTLLWHGAVGPIFAATMPKYGMSEPRNMQLSRHTDKMVCTSLRISHNGYESVNEKNASVKVTNDSGKLTVKAEGRLCNTAYSPMGKYTLSYIFDGESVEIRALSESGGRLILPVICSKSDNIAFKDQCAVINRKNHEIYIESDSEIRLDPKTGERSFNVVGGFLTAPLFISLEENKEVRFKLVVKP